MKLNEKWHGAYVNTKTFNFGVAPLQLKTKVKEDDVITSKMSKEELDKYLKSLEHKEINRVKGEEQ